MHSGSHENESNKFLDEKLSLKVLTNEKEGGLEVVAFRLSLKLFKLRFSNKSAQAPYSERSKTTQ